MATKADFSDEEWKALQKGVTGAGMLVSVSDRDFTDSFGEASALAKALGAQRDSTTSPFVRELANIRGTGFGVTASPQEVETETLASLRSSVATLEAKAPDDIDAYRTLVLEVSEAVADAKGGVKPTEAAAIDQIRNALAPDA